MRTNIVVDKSYLEGVSMAQIRTLARTSRLLVSDALFYELLTTDLESRKKCFSKFPAENNPVDLISHIGPLMRLEIDTKSRAGKPSERRENLNFNFKFNNSLVQDNYQLPLEAIAAIDEYTSDLRSDVTSYLERVALVPTFFPDLLKGSTEERKAAATAAEEVIAAPGALLPFYSNLDPPPGESPLPSAEMIDET